jgi:hypothetical protein
MHRDGRSYLHLKRCKTRKVCAGSSRLVPIAQTRGALVLQPGEVDRRSLF